MPCLGPLPRLLLAGFLLAAPASAQTMAALNASARAQIASLQAEKAGRSPAQRKMDSRLVHRVKKARGERIGAGRIDARVKLAPDGRELVDIKAAVTDGLLEALRAGGAEIVASVPRFHAVRAKVALGQIEALAGRDDVQFVKPAARAFTNAGAFSSSGDRTHGADTVRTTFRATGRGVKVGVLSDSVDFLSMAQSTLDLGVVTVLPGQDGLGGTGEGTAMLEIVHDLAPDAELYFASAFISEAQFAQNILDLRSAGCDIIVDDVIYLDESPFMDGPVAQAADAVVSDGALFFSSAGNEGNKNDNTSGTWEGDFVDGGAVGAPIVGNGRLHAFGANNFNTALGNGNAAILFWADAYGASSNDYDLYLLDATGTIVLDSSTNPQTGSQDPFEFIDSPPPGSRIVIVKADDAQPRFLHLKNFRGRLSASTSGACTGHAAASNAIAVAAVNAATSNPNPFTGGAANPVETFSSDGFRRIYFNGDGTPITPGDFSATGGTVRQKPDIAAADGVPTATPGFNPFFGTSAAAPHAAAVAALVWSYNRTLSAAQVRAAVTNTALDIEGAGTDRDSGVGIVMTPAAIGATAPGPIINVVSANVIAESFLPPNNTPDPGETITVALTLRNVGTAPATVTARLLPMGGVSAPGGIQSYGALAENGGQAARNFTFTSNGPAGGALDTMFAVGAGAVSLGTFTVPFVLGTSAAPVQFNNGNPITINDNAAASPYPSQINVAGLAGNVGKVSVTLRQLSHTQPGDLSMLLVSPSGRAVEFYKGAGAGNPVTNITFTVDDAGTAALPNGTLTSGAFRPAQYDPDRDPYTSPAPPEPYGSTLGTFNGDTPNGTWSLFVIDSYTGDIGALNAGWSLTITPAAAATNGTGPDLGVLVAPIAPLSVGDTTTLTVEVFNNGPAAANIVTLNTTLPNQFIPTGGSITQGSGSFNGQDVTLNFGTIPSGGSAALFLDCDVGGGAGTPVVSFVAGLSGADNNPANNFGSTSAVIGRANLSPGQIILSTEPGTSTDAGTISSSQPIFVDFRVSNGGNGPASQPFVTYIYLDGVLKRTITRSFPLGPGKSMEPVDLALGRLSTGQHTLVVRTDAGLSVPESNESDNEIVRTFTVQGPNLAPGVIIVSNVTATATDTPVFQTTDPVFVDFSAINNGQSDTETETTAQLFLDGNMVTQIIVPAALGPGESAGAVDVTLGSLTPGIHTLRIVLDADNALSETNEADNEFTRNFSVNAPPTITPIVDRESLEDTPGDMITFSVSDAETGAANLAVSAASANPNFLLTIDGTGPNRSITVTPTADSHGSGLITVTVDDGTGGKATSSFTFTVLPVNDPPSFIGGPSQVVTEDAGAIAVLGWAQAIRPGPSNESSQTVYFDATIGNPGLFEILPSVSPEGTLTFTLAADAHGSSTVSFRLFDSEAVGATGFSAPHVITITVLSVNDPPTFTPGGNVTVSEDSGPAAFVGWATSISHGPGNEAEQSVRFTLSNDRPTLFAAQPAIDSGGTLTFMPASNQNGSATVTVIAQDSEGAIVAMPATFTVTLEGVNDAPVFTLAGDLAVAQDAGAQSFANFAGSISPGPVDESTQTVAFDVVAANPALFAVPPAIAASGTLVFTPSPTASGSTSVSVTARDSSGATSAPRSFRISVTSFVEEAGTYNGLSRPPDVSSSSAAQTGFISARISPTGMMTGKFRLGGVRYSFKGFVLNDGRIRFGGAANTASLELRRHALSPLQLSLRLDVSGGSGQITGIVLNGALEFANIVAERAGYDPRTAPAPPPFVGRYTVLFPNRTGQNNSVPPSQYPLGEGVATLTLRSSGVASLRGTLADGSKISATSVLSASNRWPVCVETDRRRGALAGFVDFVADGDNCDAVGTGLLWYKPENPRAVRYRAGWPGGIFVDFAGGRFAPVQGESLIPGLGVPDADGNVEFGANGGGVAVPLAKALRIDSRDRVTVVSPAADGLRLSINRRSGLLRGRFVPVAGERPVSFNGAVLQSQLRAGGFYLGRKESGTISLTPDDAPGTP